jgi:TRAP transporter TAXI family solute receptor
MKRLYLCGVAMILVALISIGLAVSPSMAREPIQIEVLGAGAGGRGYTYAHVLAEVINKHGPGWLKATSSATRGHVENILLTYKDPARRAKAVLYTGDIVLDAARFGIWDFKEKISGIKVFAITHVGIFYVETLDPKIRKWSDLAGKKVATDKSGSAKARYFADMFAQAGFPVDQVKITVKAANDAIIAGTIDAKSGNSIFTGAEPEHQAPTIELMSRKREKLHFVTIPKDVVQRAAKATGIRYVYSEFPPKSFAPWQTEPVGGFIICNMWGVWPEFPNDVVYEIVKTLYENAETFQKYHVACRGFSKKSMAYLNVIDMNEVHPAALKFYKEKGIKVGLPEKLE